MKPPQLYKAVCADCGNECQVPFKPTPQNPAYCRTCYQKRKTELSKEAYEILRKPNGAVNPVAIVATVDPNGNPRTAPFGSLRAITPKLLRLVTWHGNDTYNNLKHDGRVMIAVQAPPNIAISIRGHAKIIKEKMNTDQNHATAEITIEEIKNDMFHRGTIQTPLTITIQPEHKNWFQTILTEAENIEQTPQPNQPQHPNTASLLFLENRNTFRKTENSSDSLVSGQNLGEQNKGQRAIGLSGASRESNC